MALRDLRNKISSLKNTSKVTKAMEVVSSVKLKKVEESTVNANNYLSMMREFLYACVRSGVDLDLPLFDSGSKETTKALVLVIGTGRGLVGPLLSKLKTEVFLFDQKLRDDGITPTYITVKTKTLEIFRELKLNSDLHFSGTFEEASTEEIAPLKTVILENYPEKVQKVYVIFMKFNTVFNQEVAIEKFIPLDKEDFPEMKVQETTFEPGARAILQSLLDDYLEAFLIYTLLNSNCSEFASRVVAMKQANNNANELQREFQLEYNKTRQTQITSQIQEAYLSSYTD